MGLSQAFPAQTKKRTLPARFSITNLITITCPNNSRKQFFRYGNALPKKLPRINIPVGYNFCADGTPRNTPKPKYRKIRKNIRKSPNFIFFRIFSVYRFWRGIWGVFRGIFLRFGGVLYFEWGVYHPESISELIRFQFLRRKNHVLSPEIASPRGPSRQKLRYRNHSSPLNFAGDFLVDFFGPFSLQKPRQNSNRNLGVCGQNPHCKDPALTKFRVSGFRIPVAGRAFLNRGC